MYYYIYQFELDNNYILNMISKIRKEIEILLKYPKSRLISITEDSKNYIHLYSLIDAILI